MRALLAVTIGVLVVGAPSSARADSAPSDETVRLIWVRGPGADKCESGAILRDRVTDRLGRNPFSERGPRSIEGLVERDNGRWVARLFVRDAAGRLSGTRVLASEDDDCVSLDAATVLAVALVIDPEAALRPPGESPPPTEEGAPAPPPPPPRIVEVPAECPAAAPCPPPAPHTETTVTARGVVATTLLPKTSGGFALATDVLLAGPFHGQAGVFFLPEQRTERADFAFGLTAATLGACVEAWRYARGWLGLCGDVEAGFIHAVVFDLEPTKPGDRPWVGVSATAKASLRLFGPITAEIGGGTIVPVLRQRFFVESRSGTVFQEGNLAAIGLLGLGATIQ